MQDARGTFFSVIVPAYNVEKYIGDCVDSILVSVSQLHQTDSGVVVEVIVVDDGSTDGTGRIADEYAVANTIVRVIHQANKGSSMARNVGILKARGRYLIFIDGDDMLTPCAVSSVYQTLKHGPRDVDIVMSKYKRIDNNGNITKEEFKDLGTWSTLPLIQLKEKLVDKYAPWFCCVRTQYITDNWLFFEPGFMSQDSENTPYKMLLAHSIVINDEFTHLYRADRVGSITNAKNNITLHKMYIITILWAKFHAIHYDMEQLQIAENHVRKFYLQIVLKEVPKCKHTDYYAELLRATSGAAYVLAGSKVLLERTYYITSKVMGIRAAIYMLRLHRALQPDSIKRWVLATWLWRKVLRPMREKAFEPH